jgi:hypothetical protein
LLFKLLNQAPGEHLTLMAQTLLLDIALNLEPTQTLNLEEIKKLANEYAKQVKTDKDFETVRDALKQKTLLEGGKK